MESSKTIDKKVGLFVVIGLCFVAAFILIIGNQRSMFDSKIILKVRFPQVQGLSAGSIVQVNGVMAGNIDRIEFADSESSELIVFLKIDQKYQNKITEGSFASVRTQGALGDKMIYIIPNPESKNMIQDGAFILAEKNKDLLTTLAERGNEITQVFEILSEMKTLMKSINDSQKVPATINNLHNTSAELNTLIKSLNQLIGDPKMAKSQDANLHSSIKNLNSILYKIDSGKGSLGQLINDPSIHQGLKRILNSGDKNSSMKGIIRESIKQSEN